MQCWAEILHHLGCMKPYKQWDKLHINWCRISAINSSNFIFSHVCFWSFWDLGLPDRSCWFETFHTDQYHVAFPSCSAWAGKRRKARGNHGRWTHVFTLNVFKHEKTWWEWRDTFRHFQRRQIQVSITSHGSRLRITAPFGYQWVVGPTNTFSSSLSSVFCHVFEFYNVSILHSFPLLIYISCIVDLVCVFLCTFVLKQSFGFTGAQPILTAQSSMTAVTLATVVYDPINAPAADPKNQLELTLVRDTACHTSTRFCVATRFCVTNSQLSQQAAIAANFPTQLLCHLMSS